MSTTSKVPPGIGYGYLGVYTATSLPNPATFTLQTVFVESGTGAASLGYFAYSDGNSWQTYATLQSFANAAEFPSVGTAATLYLAQDTGALSIWNSTAYQTVGGGGTASLGGVTTLASASTVNIGAASTGYINITGTTTINAFDTVAAGTLRFVRFSGNLTLTYNATSMILPGAVSISVIAGDVAIFISEGSGNWRCASYEPVSVTGTGATVKANAPTITNGYTSAGSVTTPANALPALAIDTTKYLDTKTISADSTFTFSATPAADTWFGLFLTNSDTNPHLITIPSSFSIVKKAAITGFYISAGEQLFLMWRYTGSTYVLFGESPGATNYAATTAPTITDDASKGYVVGSPFFDTTNNLAYFNIYPNTGAANWLQVNHRGTWTLASPPPNPKAGQTAYFTDVDGGYTLFKYGTYNSQTQWFPAGRAALLDQATLITATASSSEQNALRRLIPGTALFIGAKLLARVELARTNTTNDMTLFQFRIGTAGTTADTAFNLWNFTNPLQTTKTAASFEIEFTIASATTIRLSGRSTSGNSDYTAASYSVDPTQTFTIPNISGGIYFDFCTTMAASGTQAQIAARMELLPPGGAAS